MYEKFAFSDKSMSCYGLEVVTQRLKDIGIECDTFKVSTENPVLVSVYWPEQIYDLIKWRYNSFMKNRQILVGGNTPTTNPAVLLPFVDGVYLGDGEIWDGKMIGPNIVNPDTAEPKQIAISPLIKPVKYEDVQRTPRSFIEISRGCRNGCLFCQYGWLKPYREASLEDIKKAMERASTKTIRVFAADRFQHKNYPEIREALTARGSADSGSDVSMKFLLKHPEYLKISKKIRIGLDGLSQRLRFMVGKKTSDDDVLEFCQNVVDAGIKSFDWYVIYGLPTETKEDIRQFGEMLKRVDKIMPKNYALALHWNAFTPTAQTPFQWEIPAYYYPFEETLRKAAVYYNFNNMKVIHLPRFEMFTSPETVLKRALAIRGSQANKSLMFTVANKPALFKQQGKAIINQFKKETGNDLVGRWPDDAIFPWDQYVQYEKERMLRLRNHNIEKYKP